MLVVLSWWVWMQILGLLALPLAWFLFRRLPDRGHAFARPLGLLLMTYVLWLGGSLHILRNTVGGALVGLLAVAAASAWAWRQMGGAAALAREATAYWREHKAALLTTEVLFLICLGGWSLYRAYAPDIATAGGEKFMEFAFINSILRSPTFPPPDPWLSGYGISYYYFGYVMLATLTRLSGFPANLTFNVALALLFSLTVTGAFSLVYNLVVASGSPVRRGVAAGYALLGPFLLAIVGNLEGFLEFLHARGFGSPAFWAWLDIRDLTGTPTGAWPPTRFIWWWRASRVLQDYDLMGNAIEIIDEFPFFSFMLGDIHPHVLALPFGLMALALALNLWRGAGERLWAPAEALRGGGLARFAAMARRTVAAVGLEGFFWALALGGLAFLNTWDFPIYLAVFLMACFLSGWSRHEEEVVGQTLVLGLLLLGAGVVLYLPFYLGFQSQAGGLLPSVLFRTKVQHYLVMFGPLLVPAWGLLGLGLWRWWRAEGPRALPIEGKAALVGACILTVGLAVFRRWATALMLVLLVGLALALLGRREEKAAEGRGGAAEAGSSEAFALLLLAAGVGLTFLVEWVYLKDLFLNRMNTIFKFYFQAWVMLAVAGGFAVFWVTRQAGRAGKALFSVAFALVFAAGMVYPLAAAPSRADGFQNPPTLDGTAWIARSAPDDYAAAAWLNAHVQGPAVLVEAPGGSYTYYGRMAAMTGLSTLLGWDFHEYQWRGKFEEPGKRGPVVEQIYKEVKPEAIRPLLEQYGVEFVYVGRLERDKYKLTPPMVEKFKAFMDLVYEAGDVRIYRRAW